MTVAAPTFERYVTQLDGCSLCGGTITGGFNCNCAADAMWLYRASQGRVATSSCHVRDLMDDCVGGTRLEQAVAVNAKYGIAGGTLYKPAPFDTIKGLVQTGRFGAILQIDYSPLVGTRFDCFFGGFRDGHSVFLSNGDANYARTGDPGANGRVRNGRTAPKGFQDIPWSLLKTAAGYLDLGSGVTMNQEYGGGHAFALMTPADPVVSTQVYVVSISGKTQLYAKPNGALAGTVSRATYHCTKSKVAGLWWYRITGQPGGVTGRYFKPNRYTSFTKV